MNRYFRGLRLLVTGCLVILCSVFPAKADASSETAAVRRVSKNSPSDVLQARFYQVLQLIFQERYAEAGDEIRALADKGRDSGYRSFPEFSMIFFREADSIRNKNPELAAFYVRHAIQLSPNDLSVALSSFDYVDLVDRANLWKHARETFWATLWRPAVLVPILLNAFMLLLSAMTIAALIGAFVQLLRHGDLVFRYVTRFIPKNWRGLFGPLAVLCVIALPLTLGPAVAVAAWAVILSRSVRHCRWFTVLVACVLIGWAGMMHFAIPMKSIVDSEITKVVDQLNSSALAINAEKILQTGIEKDGKNALLTFSLARLYAFEGRYEDASQLFRLSDGLGEGGEISRASRLNLAVLAMRAQNWDEARTLLEQDEAKGSARFEVIYNLALVHLAQLGIEKYRAYYTQAQDLDPLEWQRLDSEQGEQHLPAWSNVRTMGFWGAFLALPYETSEAAFPKVVEGRNRLATSLVGNSSYASIGLLGAALLLVSSLRRSRTGKQWIDQQREMVEFSNVPKDSSLLWSLLPGGVFLAGRRPVAGVFFAAICFSVVFVMTGWPLHFIPLSVHPLSVEKYAFSSFLIAYGLGFIVPVCLSMVTKDRVEGATA